MNCAETEELVKTRWRFEELDDDAKDTARQKLIESIFLWNDWWEHEYEYFKEECGNEGFRVDEICFQLHVQGSGVGLKGWIDLQKLAAAKIDVFPECLATRWAAQDDLFDRVHVQFGSSSGYYSIVGGADWDGVYEEIERGPFAGMAFEDFEKLVDFDELQKALKEYVKDKERVLYKRLQDEDEYMSSDEYLSEMADANDWEFDEEGNWL